MSVVINGFDTGLESIYRTRPRVIQVAMSKTTNQVNQTVATVSSASGDSVLVESITVRTTQTAADLTSIAVEGGPSQYITFIDAASTGLVGNLDQVGKEVSWVGAIELASGATIVMDVNGGGVNTYNCTVTIKYRSANPLGTGKLS